MPQCVCVFVSVPVFHHIWVCARLLISHSQISADEPEGIFRQGTKKEFNVSADVIIILECGWVLEWYPFLPGSRSHAAPRQVRVSSRLLIALGFTARPLEAPTSEPILLCFPDHTHLLPVRPLFSLFHSPCVRNMLRADRPGRG